MKMKKHKFAFIELLFLIFCILFFGGMIYGAYKEDERRKCKESITHYVNSNASMKNQIIQYYTILSNADKESETYKNIQTQISVLKDKILENEKAIHKIKSDNNIE